MHTCTRRHAVRPNRSPAGMKPHTICTHLIHAPVDKHALEAERLAAARLVYPPRQPHKQAVPARMCLRDDSVGSRYQTPVRRGGGSMHGRPSKARSGCMSSLHLPVHHDGTSNTHDAVQLDSPSAPTQPPSRPPTLRPRPKLSRSLATHTCRQHVAQVRYAGILSRSEYTRVPCRKALAKSPASEAAAPTFSLRSSRSQAAWHDWRSASRSRVVQCVNTSSLPPVTRGQG